MACVVSRLWSVPDSSFAGLRVDCLDAEISKQSHPRPPGRAISGVVALVTLALGLAATATAVSADAWSAAAAAEREILRVYPWDPESFRHPEQYDQAGRLRSGRRQRPDSPLSSPAPVSTFAPAAVPDDGTGRPPF
jgi:hypothetical protein